MSQILRFTISAVLFALIVFALFAPVQAQTQASCQFTTTFSIRFSVGTATRSLIPRGVNDYSTVVGDGFDDTNFVEKAFTRWSNGTFSYYQHNTNDTFFGDRNNAGITIGEAGPLALGSANGTPFKLQGSTFTPLIMTIGGTTYKSFSVSRINGWGSVVGTFKDSSGKMHGFKHYSNGAAIALDYPGAAETSATGINDNGAVVGWYSKNVPPNEWKHGFIYSNGKWATLDFPGTQTTLSGISNTNLIIATTNQGSTSLNSYIYVNNTFKKMVMPNSNVPTYAFGVSLNKGLITGFSGFKGFIATCH
jgi:probable HAF family extracellular repeat protein